MEEFVERDVAADTGRLEWCRNDFPTLHDEAKLDVSESRGKIGLLSCKSIPGIDQ